MPIYDVKCKECSVEGEVLVKKPEEIQEMECPQCGAEPGCMEKQVSASSFHLVGSGWARDRYR